MNQSPLDLLSEDDRKELELLMSIIHSETLSTAARLEEVARLLAKHGLLIPASVADECHAGSAENQSPASPINAPSPRRYSRFRLR